MTELYYDTPTVWTGSSRVDSMANRLLAASDGVWPPRDSSSWKIIEEMLDFASTAEQKIAEQSRRIVELESLSVTDELTGLANRRGFDRHFERVLASARRHGERGLFVFVDLDDFKVVNDRYGHQTGDAVLRKVARIISGNVRSSDFVARLGGDEFAVLLVHAQGRGAMKRVSTLVRAMNGAELSPPAITISASIGVASFGSRSTGDAVLRAADRAMYRQKARRRTAPRLAAVG